jgi:NAD(P)-dependent dehydrogenase (short-subunit alcohol dehydrogenase family)
MTQTWFITGTSRGLGAEIAKAALSGGHNVVATGRKVEAVTETLGPDGDSLQAVKLDITDAKQAAAAVNTAISRFGGIDVLVNNAGYAQLGFFEENTLEGAGAQFDTNLFGTLIVTWAALPVMRAARKGRIFNISSLAGIRGSQTGSIYCASKFAVEGFSESLAQEVAPFGLSVTMVEPGLFRTGFLDDSSVRFGEHSVADYAEQSAKLRERYRSIAGQQKGDPRKLALAIVQLANEQDPPLRFAAGSDAIAAIEAKIDVMRNELNRWRKLSISTDGYQ